MSATAETRDALPSHLPESFVLRNAAVVRISEGRLVPNALSNNVQLANVARQQIVSYLVH